MGLRGYTGPQGPQGEVSKGSVMAFSIALGGV
jgi:hypothetical protein